MPSPSLLPPPPAPHQGGCAQPGIVPLAERSPNVSAACGLLEALIFSICCALSGSFSGEFLGVQLGSLMQDSWIVAAVQLAAFSEIFLKLW